MMMRSRIWSLWVCRLSRRMEKLIGCYCQVKKRGVAHPSAGWWSCIRETGNVILLNLFINFRWLIDCCFSGPSRVLYTTTFIIGTWSMDTNQGKQYKRCGDLFGWCCLWDFQTGLKENCQSCTTQERIFCNIEEKTDTFIYM